MEYSAQPMHAPAQSGYPNQNVVMMPQPKIRDYLAWSILNVFIGVFVLGLVALIMSIFVRNHRRDGDFAKARTYSGIALACNIVATVLGLIVWGVVIYYIVRTVTTVTHIANSI